MYAADVKSRLQFQDKNIQFGRIRVNNMFSLDIHQLVELGHLTLRNVSVLNRCPKYKYHTSAPPGHILIDNVPLKNSNRKLLIKPVADNYHKDAHSTSGL